MAERKRAAKRKTKPLVALVGLTGPDGERYEVGDDVSALPAADRKWLAAQGLIGRKED